MSLLSKITGSDARKRKKQAAAEKPYGGNPGTQYLQGMKRENDMSGQLESERQADRQGFMSTLEGGQKALEASTQAAMSAAMPSLFQALQGTKESNIRRGIYNGETPTSYEGDVTSAFQRNIANAVAGQSMDLFNTQASGRQHLLDLSTATGERSRERYYDLIAGKLDRDQNRRNAKAATQQGYIDSALGLASLFT